MNPKCISSIGLLIVCVVVLSQCALYDKWTESFARSRNPVFVNSSPVSLAAVPLLDPPLTPQVSVMPVVPPVRGRLLNESTYAFGGRTYLEQRIVIRESPLETELRITQIP